jgi:hypothetical protein
MPARASDRPYLSADLIVFPYVMLHFSLLAPLFSNDK